MHVYVCMYERLSGKDCHTEYKITSSIFNIECDVTETLKEKQRKKVHDATTTQVKAIIGITTSDKTNLRQSLLDIEEPIS